MEIVIVERTFVEPVEFEHLQAIEDSFAWCLDARNINFLHSYFSLDRKRMICVYRAPDAESVREANSQAKMPFDRIWSAKRYVSAGETPA